MACAREDGAGNCSSSHQLYRNGSGFSSVDVEDYDVWRAEHPCVLENFEQLKAAASGKLLTVFLDYDGTLTPIVSNPDAAELSADTREVVRRVAQLFPTAIVSGRGREKVEQFVQLQGLYYAGSHGMDIVGPRGASAAAGYAGDTPLAFQPAADFEPLMRRVCAELGDAVRGIPGAAVEDNKFCLSVHFRNCDPGAFPQLVAAVERVAAAHEVLRITRGRKVLEVRPQVEWDKGAALVHLLGMLGLHEGQVYCLYIGDDRTDEDAFKVLAERSLGGGILVSTRAKPTEGRWTLRDPGEVAAFLSRLVDWGESDTNGWHSVGGCNGWKIAASVRQQCGPLGTTSTPATPGADAAASHAAGATPDHAADPARAPSDPAGGGVDLPVAGPGGCHRLASQPPPKPLPKPPLAPNGVAAQQVAHSGS